MEILQETYLSFYRLYKPEVFNTWLSKIVVNKCKDFLGKSTEQFQKLDAASSGYNGSNRIDMDDVRQQAGMATKFYLDSKGIELYFNQGEVSTEAAEMISDGIPPYSRVTLVSLRLSDR